MDAEILHLFVSPGHSYFGHYGRPAGEHAMLEVSQLTCVSGRGIVGDRYFDHHENYKGQITFFDEAVHHELMPLFQPKAPSPSAYRRNVIVRGLDLNSLIGAGFELQGILFQGIEECRPCFWMDQAVGSGAESAMRGRGGLRARILTNGILRRTNRLISSAPAPLQLSSIQ